MMSPIKTSKNKLKKKTNLDSLKNLNKKNKKQNLLRYNTKRFKKRCRVVNKINSINSRLSCKQMNY